MIVMLSLVSLQRQSLSQAVRKVSTAQLVCL